MKVTYFGHACISVEVSGKKLLFDPFIRPNELAIKIDHAAAKKHFADRDVELVLMEIGGSENL